MATKITAGVNLGARLNGVRFDDGRVWFGGCALCPNQLGPHEGGSIDLFGSVLRTDPYASGSRGMQTVDVRVHRDGRVEACGEVVGRLCREQLGRLFPPQQGEEG